MAVRREDFVMREGFELVPDGLGDDTRRDPGSPRAWRGLTACDRTLLEEWMGSIRQEVLELHTDVPVGCIPEVDVADLGEFVRDRVAESHPLRIDVCVRRSTGWVIAELKPDAGYKALGQVLCYGFWAPHCCGVLRAAGLVVVTDRVQEAIRPVYEAHGVSVVELGDVFEEGFED